MLTRFINNPQLSRFIPLHNTREWQIAEVSGGCELLLKHRCVDAEDKKEKNIELHDCYPNLFFQGEVADTFLSELAHAQKTCKPSEIDRLMLDEYKNNM